VLGAALQVDLDAGRLEAWSQLCDGPIDIALPTGTPRVVVDPDPDNVRAIRAYEKAGFVRDRLVDTPDGISLLMVRDA